MGNAPTRDPRSIRSHQRVVLPVGSTCSLQQKIIIALSTHTTMALTGVIDWTVDEV